MNSQDIINTLSLQKHPEGGYYREIYRSPEVFKKSKDQIRSCGTIIYYLLEGHDYSRFHRLRSDEMWHYHQGECIELNIIREGEHSRSVLGPLTCRDAFPCITIPAGSWFSACIASGKGYALVSCTVIPGFDFKDFELADARLLAEAYPHLEELILRFG